MNNSELIERVRTAKDKMADRDPVFDMNCLSDVEDVMSFGGHLVEWTHNNEDVPVAVLCPTHSIESGWVWGSMDSENSEIVMHDKALTYLEAWTQMLEWIVGNA